MNLRKLYLSSADKTSFEFYADFDKISTIIIKPYGDDKLSNVICLMDDDKHVETHENYDLAMKRVYSIISSAETAWFHFPETKKSFQSLVKLSMLNKIMFDESESIIKIFIQNYDIQYKADTHSQFLELKSKVLSHLLKDRSKLACVKNFENKETLNV